MKLASVFAATLVASCGLIGGPSGSSLDDVGPPRDCFVTVTIYACDALNAADMGPVIFHETETYVAISGRAACTEALQEAVTALAEMEILAADVGLQVCTANCVPVPSGPLQPARRASRDRDRPRRLVRSRHVPHGPERVRRRWPDRDRRVDRRRGGWLVRHRYRGRCRTRDHRRSRRVVVGLGGRGRGRGGRGRDPVRARRRRRRMAAMTAQPLSENERRHIEANIRADRLARRGKPAPVDEVMVRRCVIASSALSGIDARPFYAKRDVAVALFGWLA